MSPKGLPFSCVCIHVSMRIGVYMLGLIILYHSSTLFNMAGCLHQTQSTPRWLLSLASLLWGSCPHLLKTGTTGELPYPFGMTMGPGTCSAAWRKRPPKVGARALRPPQFQDNLAPKEKRDKVGFLFGNIFQERGWAGSQMLSLCFQNNFICPETRN